MKSQKAILSILFLLIITSLPTLTLAVNVEIRDLSTGAVLPISDSPVEIFDRPVGNFFIDRIIVESIPGESVDSIQVRVRVLLDDPEQCEMTVGGCRVQIFFADSFGSKRPGNYDAGFRIQGTLSGGKIEYTGTVNSEVIVNDPLPGTFAPRPHFPPSTVLSAGELQAGRTVRESDIPCPFQPIPVIEAAAEDEFVPSCNANQDGNIIVAFNSFMVDLELLQVVATRPGASGRAAVDEALTGIVPFAEFNAKLKIDLDRDEFAVQAFFRLGDGSDGIDPLTEDVGLKIGTFSTTIPAGRFRQLPYLNGGLTFEGVINGVNLAATIQPFGPTSYVFRAVGTHANLTGTTNPVPVEFIIGNDGGATSVNAKFDD